MPHVATSWDVSPDLKTYTFHLRSDVKWSDGEPFSSADVAFTLLEVAKFNTYQTQTLANVASVETPDAATFVVQGTRITARPPHRTVRAAFPHTAPTVGV